MGRGSLGDGSGRGRGEEARRSHLWYSTHLLTRLLWAV